MRFALTHFYDLKSGFWHYQLQIYELFQYVPRFLEKSCLIRWIKKQEGVSKV